jgi:hypothetical protein
MATPSRDRTREEKLKTITSQLYTDDLLQLDALADAGGNRENTAHLRRIALHIGTLVLSFSTRALFDPSEPIGLFTAEEVARDLLPRLAPAIQTLERLGYTVHPLPAGMGAVLEMLARLGSLVHADYELPLGVSEQQQEKEASTSGSEDEDRTQQGQRTRTNVTEQSERLVPSREALQRMGIEEGTV